MTDAAPTDGRSPLHLSLDVPSPADEVVPAEPDPDDELRRHAATQIDQLLSVDPADESSRTAARSAVESMGRDLQRRSASRSAMLQAPLRELSSRAEDGGPVARSLADLRIQVEELDPSGLDTDAGWFTRAVGKLPGVGTPLKRYFMRYESAQTQIDSIVRSLEQGRDVLRRDNVTLGADQAEMRELTTTLTEQVALARALDAEVTRRLSTDVGPDDPRRAFVEEELLFAIRQRTLDLQQQLAVNQQGVLATELVIRNNRELIRGVDRALDVTISALQVAVTVALALAHQRIVLDKVEALNETTSTVIAGTAARLRAQGTEIHRQATGTMIDMEALRAAFADIDAALDEISRYRREALPTMASGILELDRLAADGEEAIDRMERGRDATARLDAGELGAPGAAGGTGPSGALEPGDGAASS